MAGWQSDLDALLPRMDALHPDLDHDTPIAELERAITELRDRAPTSSDDELLVAICRVVALVSAGGRDAHTGLYPWNPGSTYPVRSLPLRLWDFPEGVTVVDALPPYEDLVGTRIVAIGGQPVADVVAALDPLIPRDNAQTVRLLTPRFLLIPEILHGLDVIDVAGPVEIEVLDGGVRRLVRVDPVPMAEYNDWAGPYGLHLPRDAGVAYLARMDEALWWEVVDGATLFVQYNTVVPVGAADIAAIRAAASDDAIARVVVDIRHNTGGEVSAVRSMVSLFDDPSIDRPGRLFLLGGRNSFSAATMFAAQLEERTAVSIVGEPMAGAPNFWGNARDVNLDWSGLVVGVSTLYEQSTAVDDDRLAIEVDLPRRLDVGQLGQRLRPGVGRDPEYRGRRETMTEPPRRTTYSIFFDLFVLGQRVRGLLATAMADAPLRPEDYATYSVVFEDEQVSPTQMAAQLSMPLTTVVDAIRVMEARGHARRIANPRDGRSYLVVLTAEGQRAHAEANRRFEVAYRAFADALPTAKPRPVARSRVSWPRQSRQPTPRWAPEVTVDPDRQRPPSCRLPAG